MNILIKNVSPATLKRLKDKMPTANLSIVIRALISHATTMTDEQFTQIINKQASNEQQKAHPNE